ncbi:magnesium-chelatase 38 kDa subunit [Oxobacter pfennigii]|uniref:Magnesium-chelatase 38 kDa subunit n=1 Tax=Oxobacter pfennigii TaxID=36849 RepID=A0A0P8WY82_9CLOT|nr:magnesium chelatase subunit D family protein [Oxobacter pfennigii]KPU43332.1 magnesium-chelatase 38 kDa subunit [Oxobacter pfennigii]
MDWKNVFPFCAILGQDDIKKALILNAVNPSIGGLLISGEKGTGKSTLVRGLAKVLRDIEVVELPLNVTEDRLIGTIDMEKAIKNGEKSFEPGIFKKADRNILYIDEVNLLSEYIVNCLLEVSASHINHVEREGISFSHPSKFILVGTMNPEEGKLRTQFLDRFGLYVEAKGSRLLEERKEIIKRRLEYEQNAEEYISKWRAETERLSQKISDAKKALSGVKISENIMKLAAEISKEGNCAGHRAELVTVETARAIAAFGQRKYVTAGDVKEAAKLTLPHRIRHFNEQQPIEYKECDQNQYENENDSEEYNNPEGTQQPKAQDPQHEDEDTENGVQGMAEQPDMAVPDDKGDVQQPGEVFEIKPINLKAADKKMRKGSGRRSRTKTNSLQGRYIRYTFPKGKIKDVAFDATLRAAAPYQKYREKNGMAVSIEDLDFREKIREKRTGNTIIFIVDASGSMGVRQRMKAVKGAILSILNDAYQKRDKVGMIAFRKNSAEHVLGITRSVDLAQKRLKDLPTGGRTPLAAGLYRGYELVKAARLKDPDIIPFIVVVSDGRANVSHSGGAPFEEALSIARSYRAEGIKSLVINTERDFIKLGLASKIADAMGAECISLEDLNERQIEYAVRSIV